MLEKQKAIEYLKEYVSKGDKIYCILNHVSQSGMTRAVDFVVPTTNDKQGLGIYKISHLIGAILDMNKNKTWGGLTVRGCGEDVGWRVVHNLSRVVFDDGYSLESSWLN